MPEEIDEALDMAETLDIVVFTTEIFAAPEREETAEGIERDTAVERLTPLLVSPDLEGRSGAMFDRKGAAVLPSAALTDRAYVQAFIAASDALAARASGHPST